jgi:hypothetical protein
MVYLYLLDMQEYLLHPHGYKVPDITVHDSTNDLDKWYEDHGILYGRCYPLHNEALIICYNFYYNSVK